MSRRAISVAALLSVMAVMPAFSQEEFYDGKKIDLIIPANSGSYHTYALLMADHLPKHIPGNPAIAPVSMGGAGGIRASNHVANIAATDGTVLYMMHQNAPTVELLTPDKVQYKTADFQPIGVLASLNAVFVVRNDAEIGAIGDAREKEIVVGSTGVGSYTYIIPSVLNGLAGTRFKMVTTYPGTGEMMLAMEQNEIAGMMSSFATIRDNHPEWTDGTGPARLLFQVGERRNTQIADVPLLVELAQNETEKGLFGFLSLTNSFARSLVAPAGVPAERMEVLREAFDAMLADPAFQADAAAKNISLDGADAQSLQASIAALLATPASVVEIARQYATE